MKSPRSPCKFWALLTKYVIGIPNSDSINIEVELETVIVVLGCLAFGENRKRAI